MELGEIIVTFFMAYAAGYIATKIVSHFIINRAKDLAAKEAEKVQDYVLNKSRYFYIEEVNSSSGKMLLVYDYLTKEFVTQGITKDELKEKLSIEYGDKDLYFVKNDGN